MGLVAYMVKSCLQCMRRGFDSWVKKIPWRRKWLPTPVFLPGEFHGQRSLVGYSPWGHNWATNTLTFQSSEGLNGAGGLRTHISEASPGLFTGVSAPLHMAASSACCTSSHGHWLLPEWVTQEREPHRSRTALWPSLRNHIAKLPPHPSARREL